jgi:hypothetical protein
MLRVSESELEAATISGLVRCPKCGFENELLWVESGVQMKYCRVCERLQPLENFHRHRPNSRGFRTGRQLECKTCKNTVINPALNPLRTADQHREAAQRRRLFGVVAGEVGKLDSNAIFEKFGSKCFSCDKALAQDKSLGPFAFDHTLPAKLFWPMSTGTATLLCADCNGRKHELWPSQFYSDQKLRSLARLTSIDYELLVGRPVVNASAVAAILEDVDGFIEEWIAYPGDLLRVRELLLREAGIDLAERASHAPTWLTAPGSSTGA